MFVLFMALGWKLFLYRGVNVCPRINLISLLSRFMYLACVTFCSFSSIVCWIYSHVLFQALAKFRCRWCTCCFQCCFFIYKYLISSLILMLGTLCCVCLKAGEVFRTFILAYVGINCSLRHVGWNKYLHCNFIVSFSNLRIYGWSFDWHL